MAASKPQALGMVENARGRLNMYPAKAGVQGEKNWIPASAGMTNTVSATRTD
ncbi:MAG TPA: hypothetical protein VMX36_12790 [Sedimentisphaerales bacterium]|nr:hypothetical protein [Sedimentisphaerales bacterium]